jgi:hypothetical protein
MEVVISLVKCGLLELIAFGFVDKNLLNDGKDLLAARVGSSINHERQRPS